MNEQDLRAIEARADAATAGKWIGGVGDYDGTKCIGVVLERNRKCIVALCGKAHADDFEESCDNAEFIAEARQDIPALVAEVRRLQREKFVYEAAVALAETCEFGCGDYGGNIFDDELLFKYREARLNGESEGA